MRHSRVVHERQFLGVDAPLVLRPGDRVHYQSEGQRRFVALLNLDQLVPENVAGVTTSEEIEAAAEISWSTYASVLLAKNAASWLFSRTPEEDDPENSLPARREMLSRWIPRWKLGAILYNRLIPMLTSEQWLELDMYFFGNYL